MKMHNTTIDQAMLRFRNQHARQRSDDRRLGHCWLVWPRRTHQPVHLSERDAWVVFYMSSKQKSLISASIFAGLPPVCAAAAAVPVV